MVTFQGRMEFKVDSESLEYSCEFLLEEMVEWATEGDNERWKDTGVGDTGWTQSLEQAWKGESGQNGGRARLQGRYPDQIPGEF